MEVEADTIDTMFEGIDVDFLKIDVEGAEYRALVGAEKLMRRRNVRLLLEIAPWGDKDPRPPTFRCADVTRLLRLRRQRL